ncbi:methyltransferase domain-containing protein [Jannaschia sp. 2305UL9-9]|uniref:methyltransferase domain-containing protein n=1 Tax=Jannaschia sp. 2305UL9-9 TaxID=3121638 RepID=UPI00352959C8
MDQATPTTARPGGDYNDMPYSSMPHPMSRPAHLAAVARLFGLHPTPSDRARVLELGCAAGGNLIPLAQANPQSRYLGIDLTPRQVDDGRARIAALGLTNVDIRQGDIGALDLRGETFDYVICHGVYSWVPDAVQTAILEIAARCLTPNGIAYVSYNTYPGWSMKGVVRDLCMYHAGTAGTPQHRVARARWALRKLADLSPETSLHGQLLRKEAKLNAALPDSYILGEFLAEENKPCFFHTFARRALSQGLHFLSETDVASSIPDLLEPTTAEAVRAIAGGDGLAVEQYMDFFTGRQFRRSLLTTTGGDRSLGPAGMAGLHAVCDLRHDPARDDEAPNGEAWTSPAGTLRVDAPDMIGMLTRLSEAAPASLSVEEAVGGSMSGPAARRLFGLVLGGHVQLADVPLRVGRGREAMPTVWPVARAELTDGQGWLTSLRHRTVSPDDGSRRILRLMDGTRGRADLLDAIMEELRQGTLRVNGIDTLAMGADQAAAAVPRMAEAVLEKLLRFAEGAALLAPPAGTPP